MVTWAGAAVVTLMRSSAALLGAGRRPCSCRVAYPLLLRTRILTEICQGPVPWNFSICFGLLGAEMGPEASLLLKNALQFQWFSLKIVNALLQLCGTHSSHFSCNSLLPMYLTMPLPNPSPRARDR